MKLELFEKLSGRSVVADWVELKVVQSGKSVSSADLQRSDSVLSDPANGIVFDLETDEQVEREIIDDEQDAFDEAIWTELRFRESVLGDSYPFELITKHSRWELRPRSRRREPVRAAEVLYLACLIMSGMRSGLLSKDGKEDEEFDRLTRDAANVLQSASFVAASGLIGGESHWFGWPRPDGTTKMRDALNELILRIGHGKLKQRDPAWTTGYEKDGTVDLVVWRPFRDKRHGGVLVLGQVASGLNWIEKSPKTFVDSHFNDWFEEPLEHQFLTAMFIPFMLHSKAEEQKDRSFDEVAEDKIRQLSIIHGTLVDRVRLVDLVRERLEESVSDERTRVFGIGLYRWYARAYRALTAP